MNNQTPLLPLSNAIMFISTMYNTYKRSSLSILHVMLFDSLLVTFLLLVASESCSSNFSNSFQGFFVRYILDRLIVFVSSHHFYVVRCFRDPLPGRVREKGNCGYVDHGHASKQCKRDPPIKDVVEKGGIDTQKTAHSCTAGAYRNHHPPVGGRSQFAGVEVVDRVG